MALIETWLRCELGSAVQVQYLNGNLFSQDNQANLIGVRVYENGEPASLSGSVSANVIRADGGTVAVAGTLQNGNECYVILPQAAYAVPGAVSVIIKITSSGQVTTLAAAVSTVYTSSTATAVDPGTIIPSIQSLISAIETAVASIPADYSSLWTSLAPAFSTSTAYTAGQYTTYDGKLWRFTTDHAAGSWNAAHAVQANLGGDVSDLKSAFESQNDIIANFINENSLNLYNSLKAIPGYRIPVSTHEITPKSSAYISEYIPVQPNTEYTVGVCMGSNSYYTIAYYDSNKEFISGEAPGNTDPHNYTTPATAAYAILSGAIGKIEDQYFCLSSYTLSSTYSNPKMVFTNDARLISTGRLVNNTSAITNAAGKTIYLLTPDGVIRDYGTSIPITGTGNYIYWNKETNTFARKTVSYVSDKSEYLVAEFNAESFGERDITSVLSTKPFIEIDQINKKVNINLTATAYAYCCQTGVVSIPATTASLDVATWGQFILVYDLINAEFKIVTSYNSVSPSTNIAIAVIYNMNIVSNTPVITLIGKNANALKTCVCYGDSLTDYDGKEYTWGPHEGEICIGFESYLRTYCFMDVTERGYSGKTTPQICGYIRNVSDFASFDYITIMGGDNDDRVNHNVYDPGEEDPLPDVDIGILMPVGSTFDTDTVYGALQSAIEHVLGVNPSIRIILMTEPIGWTYYENKMNRVNEDIPNAYRRVAELYGLPLIDLWNESGVNELTRTTLYADPAPYNEGGTNQSYMYHPNNDGWKRISKIICNRILEL